MAGAVNLERGLFSAPPDGKPVPTFPGGAALADYLATAARAPFRYGESDCGPFAGRWMAAATGIDPSAALARRYSDARGSRAIVRSAGGLAALGARLAAEHGLIETDAPRPGDIGIVRAGGRSMFAVCVAPGVWAVKTARGLCVAPLAHSRAWTFRAGASAGAQAIGALIVSLFTANAAVGATVIVGTLTVNALIGTVVLAAVSIGVQYLLSPSQSRPEQPRAAQQQQIIRQALAPRLMHYGTVRVAGVAAFWESRDGVFDRLIMTGSREIDAVLEYFLGEREVTVSASPPYPVNESPPGAYVRIETRRGLATETAYESLIARYPGDWTADHRLDGISSVLLTLIDPGPRLISQTFEGGIPAPRVTLRGAKVYDMRTGGHDADDSTTWAWRDNPGLCIRDYLAHPDGFGLAPGEIDESSFESFADLCDQLVPLKSGGTEKRYRLSGAVSFAERRVDALRRMLETCDGQIVTLPSGQIGIVGGRYEEPEAAIDESAIIAAEWEFSRDEAETANEIKPLFVSPDHDYQDTEAAAWRDDAAISANGLVSRQLPLPMVPSHTQAQRLAKIAGRRINAPVSGKLQCNLGGLVAYQQRYVRITQRLQPGATPLVDGVFLIEDFSLTVTNDDGAVGMGVQLSVTQIDASDWEFDPETEEGDPPSIPPDTASSDAIEVPQNVGAVVTPVTLSTGVIGGQIEATWDAPARDGLVAEVRTRKSGEAYVYATLDVGDVDFVSGVIENDGSTYEVEVRFVAGAGSFGAWSPVESVTASADPVAPDPVTGLALTPGAGQIAASWTAPNSANFAGARVYWNNSNTLTGATLVATIYGAANAAQNRTVAGLSAGTKWILVTAINGSGVASAPVSDSALVT